jgi:hypothetical protein
MYRDQTSDQERDGREIVCNVRVGSTSQMHADGELTTRAFQMGFVYDVAWLWVVVLVPVCAAAGTSDWHTASEREGRLHV